MIITVVNSYCYKNGSEGRCIMHHYSLDTTKDIIAFGKYPPHWREWRGHKKQLTKAIYSYSRHKQAVFSFG